MIKSISRLLLNPHPLRSLAIRSIRKLKLGRWDERVRLGAVQRPHYAYCVWHAANLACRLGYDRMSLLEFGVAGGNGLVNLECHAAEASKLLPIGIDVYGFDTGEGLPRPRDYRDLPYHWKGGFYKMDVPALRSRLKGAKLVLGEVEHTVPRFFSDHRPAPIGAIFFDLDYYSSTIAAFRIFDGGEEHFLPRVYCYLDDVIGSEVELYNDYTGVRLAVHEFNESHKAKKLGNSYHLLSRPISESWQHQIVVYHDFEHPRYSEFVSADEQQTPLRK
ncbi:MAG: hypothetical protein ABSF95_03490 [Verrucomicrobiota bacterium]